MPQGLKGASASFSKLCQLIFRDIQNVVTYVDDLMAAATTHKEMLKLLAKVFEECRYHGMKLNLKKCILGVLELTWLGYSLNKFGISPEFDKAEAIKAIRTAQNNKGSTKPPRLVPILLRSHRRLCTSSRPPWGSNEPEPPMERTKAKRPTSKRGSRSMEEIDQNYIIPTGYCLSRL